MANVLDCELEISEPEILSSYCFSLSDKYPLERYESANPPICYGLNSITSVLLKE